MKKTTNNLILFNTIFVMALVTANVMASKLINTGIPLLGATITIPGGLLCYGITFLMTDAIGEIWGKKAANNAVKNGFICQLSASLLIFLTQYLPAVDTATQEAYNIILGQNFMFSIGSLLAYIVAQTWDVWIFHKIREQYIKKHGDVKGGKWIWNNASTMTSQIFDTVIFIGFSFGIGFGWLFDAEMLPTLFAMMIGQYFVKFLLAAADTPFFYLITRRSKPGLEAYEIPQD